MQEYVQKSTSTTRPRRPEIVSGRPPGVCSHRVIPVKAGAGPHRCSTGLAGVQSDRAPAVASPWTTRRSWRTVAPPSSLVWSAFVYPGTACCRPSVNPAPTTTAVTTRTAPMTRRADAAWVRTDRMRPARA